MKLLGIFEFNFQDLTDFSKLAKILKKKIKKEEASILFIDDENFPIVDNLKEAGWSVDKVDDVQNIDTEQVKRAHIIFVDYKGVGKKLSEKKEGIGVIKALKEKYKGKKRIILYSGFSNFSLGDEISSADAHIAKNSDTYEFLQLIETELEKL